MPVDVIVEIGLGEGEDLAAGFAARSKLDREVNAARLTGVRDVGGGTTFEPRVADAQFETQSTKQALAVVSVVAATLLNLGYTVQPINGKLIHRDSGQASHPHPGPGVATVLVLAPVGMP